MKILGITIVEQRHGADIVSLRTDLPEGCHPYRGPLCLEFRCAKGLGIRYAVTHFPDVLIEHIAHEPAEIVPFVEEAGWRISTPIDEHTCLHCKEMHGRSLPGDTSLNELPPFRQCTNPDGCRCVGNKP